MEVRTNVSAINVHRNMKNIGLRQSMAVNRLSSGFRINSAADDAAGLAVSENMRAQIRGLDQAMRNAQDGISLIQTAEGGLAAINEMIVRIRELVVQAANDTYVHDSLVSNRAMIQEEINQLIREIDAVAQRVEFNSMRLLSGNYIQRAATPVSASSIVPFSTPPLVSSDRVLNINTLAIGSSGDGWEMAAGGILRITGNGAFQINGTGAATSNRIVVEEGVSASIIAENVNISSFMGSALDMRGAEVDLWLSGNNRMVTSGNTFAGVRTADGMLRIRGNGELTAQSNIPFNPYATLATGAAIGGNIGEGSGTIHIYSGTVRATSYQGAGIGSGTNGNMDGEIIIRGGTVYATGAWGAGIGSGRQGVITGNISIYGGTVTATGRTSAGIGGGGSGDNATALVNTGVITIHGGNISAVSMDSGAGIGSGQLTSSGRIYIHGGVVYAASDGHGAAIGTGAGWNTQDSSRIITGDITISGGRVLAETRRVGSPALIFSAVVGGGNGAVGGTITISGGSLELTQQNRWIGGGTQHAPVIHGTVLYLDGNLSVRGNPPNIPSGVTDDEGYSLVVFQAFADLEPFRDIMFILDVNGEYRTFSAITDSNGNIYIWLREIPDEPPEIIDPPLPPPCDICGQYPCICQPPDNGNGYNNGTPPNGIPPDNGLPTPTPPIIPTPPPPVSPSLPPPQRGLWIQSGANANQGVFVTIGSINSEILGLRSGGYNLVDVAQAAGYTISSQISILDDALSHTVKQRANLGAMQNRLNYTIRSLGISSENLSDAFSRIRDTDIARELMALTKTNILQQAGISMLSQANQLPHQLLQLFR